LKADIGVMKKSVAKNEGVKKFYLVPAAAK